MTTHPERESMESRGNVSEGREPVVVEKLVPSALGRYNHAHDEIARAKRAWVMKYTYSRRLGVAGDSRLWLKPGYHRILLLAFFGALYWLLVQRRCKPIKW